MPKPRVWCPWVQGLQPGPRAWKRRLLACLSLGMTQFPVPGSSLTWAGQWVVFPRGEAPF